MKLQYRGVSYDRISANLTANTVKVEGKYRGHKWISHNLRQDAITKPSAHLVYRGVEVK